MGTKLRHGGLLLAVVAIALIGTSAATAANGNGNGNGGFLPELTICHKPDKDGGKPLLRANRRLIAANVGRRHGSVTIRGALRLACGRPASS